MEKEETKPIKIYNGRILAPGGEINGGAVLVSAGKIIGVEPGNYEAADFVAYDAGGNYVAPGFIDLHTHGAGGSDFMDCTEADCLTIARTHALHGTTLLYPTTLAADNRELFRFFDVYQQVKGQTTGAAFGGIHLEGPYFAHAFRGAQDARYLRNPEPEEYETILERSKDIVRWSIAPELPGALAFGDVLRKRGVLPSVAHTDATYEEIVKAFEYGFTHITHFYSCMNGITRRNGFRQAGCIEAGYLLDGLTVELITDSIHVPPPLMRLAVKIKGADKVALVTDSMRGAGMPEGKSMLGSRSNGQEVTVDGGVAWMPGRQSFAGSVATADRLVRNMYRLGGQPLSEAVRMMTLTPAAIMGIDNRKGKIAPGYDADLVVFDENIQIKDTFVNGLKIKREA